MLTPMLCRPMAQAAERRDRMQSWLPILLAVLFLVPSELRADESHVFFADRIWTGPSSERDSIMLRDAAMIIRDGRIVKIAARKKVDPPPGAQIHDLGNVTIIPGLVIAQSNYVRSTRADEPAVNPDVQAVDGFDAFDDYDSLIAAGITTLQVSPAANRLIPGMNGVVRLAADPGKHVLKQQESLGVILTRNGLSPSTVYEPPVGAVSVERPVEPTRPQLATSLSQALVGLDTLFRIAATGDDPDVTLDALNAFLSEKLPLRISASKNAEIAGGLRLASSFDLPWFIVNPEEVDFLIGRELWENTNARGVVLTPEFAAGRITNPNVVNDGDEQPLPVWERARKLIDAGAGQRIALSAIIDAELKNLLHTAAILGRGGIGKHQILQMLTTNPAAMMGVDGDVGSLQAGRYADFAVLTGMPLTPGTKVVATYVGGKRVFSHTDSKSPSKKSGEASAKVITAARVVGPDGVLEDASLSIVDGRIAGVGPGISVPMDAETFAYPNATVISGMIDCSTTLGLGGSFGDQITLGTKIGDYLARDDKQIALGRKGGVTSALISSTRLPSPVLAFKLTDSPRVLKDPVAIRWEMRGNLTAAEESFRRSLKSGKAYADAWNKYDSEMVAYKKKLAEYEAEKKKYDAAVKAAAAKKAAEAKKAAAEKKKESSGEKEKAEASKSDEKATEEKKAEPAKETKEERKATDGKTTSKSDTSTSKSDGSQSKSAGEKDSEKSKLVEPKKPTEPQKPKSSSSLEPYRALFAKKIAALVRTTDTKAVPVIVKLFRKEFDLRLGIEGGAALVK
ncbi:MAG: amidohydrolase family protein, partial [Planctomycetota bacterium]